MGVSKHGGFSPHIIPFLLGVFHDFHHPFWGFSPHFWFNTQMEMTPTIPQRTLRTLERHPGFGPLRL